MSFDSDLRRLKDEEARLKMTLKEQEEIEQIKERINDLKKQQKRKIWFFGL
jgi:hypothetical protein